MKAHTKTSVINRKYDDGIDPCKQTVEVDPVEHIRRCTLYKDIDIWSYYKLVCPDVRTLGDVLDHGQRVSNDGPCLGFVKLEDKIEPIRWLSYSTVIQQARTIASHLWTETKLIPMHSKVAILSSNRPEYPIVAYGCYMYGFIIVGLYTTYDPKTIKDLLSKTHAEVLIVDSLARIQAFKSQLIEDNRIKEIIVMDELIGDEHEKFRSFSSIIEKMNKADIRSRPTIDPDSVATLLLTSGTTGEKN